jgi:hypothetical protein
VLKTRFGEVLQLLKTRSLARGMICRSAGSTGVNAQLPGEGRDVH